MTYTSNLKNWGATGSEYPDGYAYAEGEQPVDDWDNFLNSNLINDVQHLIDKTNDDLLHRDGGVLLSNLDIGSHRLVGGAGYIDFSGTTLGIDAPTNILQSLDVGADITVTGTVDGVDLPTFQSNFNSHESNTNNPHSVTSSQVGAPAQSDFDSHLNDTTNPHSVTNSQVGAPSQSDFDSHLNDTTNPHSVTNTQVGAPSQSEFDSHTTNTNNPHSVTSSQVGAPDQSTFDNHDHSGNVPTVPNTGLTNSTITATSGTGLSGGGNTALGSSFTLSLDETTLKDGGAKELDASELAGDAGTSGQALVTDGSSASWTSDLNNEKNFAYSMVLI